MSFFYNYLYLELYKHFSLFLFSVKTCGIIRSKEVCGKRIKQYFFIKFPLLLFKVLFFVETNNQEKSLKIMEPRKTV